VWFLFKINFLLNFFSNTTSKCSLPKTPTGFFLYIFSVKSISQHSYCKNITGPKKASSFPSLPPIPRHGSAKSPKTERYLMILNKNTFFQLHSWDETEFPSRGITLCHFVGCHVRILVFLINFLTTFSCTL